jgi:hypothetical protein
MASNMDVLTTCAPSSIVCAADGFRGSRDDGLDSGRLVSSAAVVKLLVPRYVDGIAAVQWSLLTAPIMCLQPISNVFNVANGKTCLIGHRVGHGDLLRKLKWLIRGGPELIAFPKAMLVGKSLLLLPVAPALLGWYTEIGDT